MNCIEVGLKTNGLKREYDNNLEKALHDIVQIVLIKVKYYWNLLKPRIRC